MTLLLIVNNANVATTFLKRHETPDKAVCTKSFAYILANRNSNNIKTPSGDSRLTLIVKQKYEKKI